MYVDTDGLVIRQIKTGDGRRMLLLLTRKYGKISAGTSINERGKSKSALAIRPFTYGHYDIFKGRSAYSLNGAEVKSSFYAIGEDIDKFMLASQVLEFTEKLLPEEEPNEKIFDLLLDFLSLLTQRKAKLETLSSGYAFKALKYAGLEPQLNVCSSCGSRLKKEEGRNDFVYFSVKDGGIICEECKDKLFQGNASASNLIYKVRFDIINILKYFINNPLESLKTVGLSEESQKDVSTILGSYISYHLGIDSMKSKDIYKSLLKE